MKDEFLKSLSRSQTRPICFFVLFLSSVGSLSYFVSLCLSLSDLNKQLSKEEVSSEPVNRQDEAMAKFRITAHLKFQQRTLRMHSHNHATVTKLSK